MKSLENAQEDPKVWKKVFQRVLSPGKRVCWPVLLLTTRGESMILGHSEYLLLWASALSTIRLGPWSKCSKDCRRWMRFHKFQTPPHKPFQRFYNPSCRGFLHPESTLKVYRLYGGYLYMMHTSFFKASSLGSAFVTCSRPRAVTGLEPGFGP